MPDSTAYTANHEVPMSDIDTVNAELEIAFPETEGDYESLDLECVNVELEGFESLMG